MSEPTASHHASHSEQERPTGGDGAGVLLLAHGAPGCLEDIPEFLRLVRGGRPLPERTIKEVSARYARIGAGSPLLSLTNLQASALAAALNRPDGADGRTPGIPIPVVVGMRNWKPFIAESVRELAALGVTRIVAICLAPQNSRTSIGLYRQRLSEALEGAAPRAELDFIESWHDQPELIAAFQEKISRALSELEAQATADHAMPLIFTAHSVPASTIAAGDVYERQVRETAARVAEGLDLEDWSVAFQSQGMTSEPWLGPTVESHIDRLAAAGHRHVLICPVGFVSDHLEVLYDIDVALKDYGAARGISVHRTESLNDSPRFIAALETLVRPHLRSPSPGLRPPSPARGEGRNHQPK